jgi:hypothetical protein
VPTGRFKLFVDEAKCSYHTGRGVEKTFLGFLFCTQKRFLQISFPKANGRNLPVNSFLGDMKDLIALKLNNWKPCVLKITLQYALSTPKETKPLVLHFFVDYLVRV